MRASRPMLDPAATLAVSFVPSAMTQQPRNPAWCHEFATRYPLICPGICSTIERPPDASIWTFRTPTSRYCAASCCAGLGSHIGETMPTEVESPIWATEVQEVRVGPAGAASGRATARVPVRTAAGRCDLADRPTAAAVVRCDPADRPAAAAVVLLNTPANAALSSEITRTATRLATMPSGRALRSR